MTENGLFEGEPSLRAAQVTTASGSSVYSAATPRVAAPRHLDGYGPFVEFARIRGADVGVLARSVPATIAFITEAADGIRSTTGLPDATATFLGNVIARLRPDARWHAFADGRREVGAGRISFTIDDLVARLVEPGGVDADRVAELRATIAEWATEESDAELDALSPHPEPLDRPERLSRYRRPETPPRVFADDTGAPIPYGERWGIDGPPDDAYERVTHPERFAPLHEVANALIAFLAGEYDARLDEGAAFAAESRVPPAKIVRAAHITPAAPDAAPLTFVLTDDPGVVVMAGALYEAVFPSCGCDACDETAASAAAELEDLVFAVAEGGFGEAYPVGVARWYAQAIVAPGETSSGSGRGTVGHVPAERLESARLRLAALPHGWQPWT